MSQPSDGSTEHIRGAECVASPRVLGFGIYMRMVYTKMVDTRGLGGVDSRTAPAMYTGKPVMLTLISFYGDIKMVLCPLHPYQPFLSTAIPAVYTCDVDSLLIPSQQRF